MSTTARSDLGDDDDAFDMHFPPSIQVLAAIHYTPVAVARRAAHLLAPRDGMRVLDVGAGAGKFCNVAALERASSTFVGVEWRRDLVDVARGVAARLACANVRFVEGDAFDLSWTSFDSFYFFNPFVEHLSFVGCVSAAIHRLAEARLGTRVVTYHGLGAAPPFGYHLEESHKIGSDRLELWIKVRDAPSL